MKLFYWSYGNRVRENKIKFSATEHMICNQQKMYINRYDHYSIYYIGITIYLKSIHTWDICTLLQILMICYKSFNSWLQQLNTSGWRLWDYEYFKISRKSITSIPPCKIMLSPFSCLSIKISCFSLPNHHLAMWHVSYMRRSLFLLSSSS